MTTAVITIRHNIVTLAAESLVTTDHDKQLLKEFNSQIKKVMKIDKHFGYASAGSFAEINLFRLYVKEYEPIDNTEIGILEYMASFENWKEKYREEPSANEYLIYFKRNAFYYTYASGIFKISKFYAIGSGAPYAFTALKLGCTPKKAIEIASESDMHSGGPITLIEFDKNE